MTAIILKWIIVVLAVLNFGYMTFDGGRALVKGDYIRPATGEYAGQLGPWAGLVKAIGIEPESTAMKLVFLLWGLTGIAITIGFAMGLDWGWKALLIINICSLWYLWMGTGSSLIQLILLTLIRFFK